MDNTSDTSTVELPEDTRTAEEYVNETNKLLEALEHDVAVSSTRLICEQITNYMAHSDIGRKHISAKANIDPAKLKSAMRGKAVLTNDEQKRIAEVVENDAKLPTRKELAAKRKLRQATRRGSGLGIRRALKEKGKLL